jgi:hypothetical protein
VRKYLYEDGDLLRIVLVWVGVNNSIRNGTSEYLLKVKGATVSRNP